MDRQGKRGEIKESLLDKISIDTGYDKPKGIVAGFVPACEFVETGEIIANLAYMLAARGVVVCVVDFKVFYPNLCDWLGGVTADKKGDGLVRLLNSDRAEIWSIARGTDDKNVFLVAPSPSDDIEDYLNFSIDDVARIISLLKEVFDVVLIDIPNNPALEFCVSALMCCQRGFFLAAERIEAPRNIQKLADYASRITGNIRSFNNIILAQRQNLVYDENALMETRMGGDKDGVKLQVTAHITFNREAQQCALDGKVYVRDGSLVDRRLAKAGKVFTDELLKIANVIMEVSG